MGKNLDPSLWQILWRRHWWLLGALLVATMSVIGLAWVVLTNDGHPGIGLVVALGMIAVVRLARDSGVSVARLEMLGDIAALRRRNAMKVDDHG